MPVVTALRASRRGRVVVHVDGEILCAVSEAAVARWRLYKGRELSPDDLGLLLSEATADLALADAFRLLGHRARSTAEVRRRLLAREHPAEAVEAALQALMADGLLDDAAFAARYVAEKRRSAGWGTQRIRRGLSEAGLSRTDIEAALIGAAAGDPDNAELQRAVDVLRRRAPLHGRADDAARRRAYQLLLRRGFESGVAYAAVRRWSGEEVSRVHGGAEEVEPPSPDTADT